MNPGMFLLILIIATIASGIVLYTYRDLIYGVNTSPSAGGADRRRPGRGRQQLERSAGRSVRVQRSHALNVGSEHQDAKQRSVQRSALNVQSSESEVISTHTDQITLTTKELTQVARAMTLYAQSGVEQSAIEQAFEVTKGGSKGWKRSKLLFDLARSEKPVKT